MAGKKGVGFVLIIGCAIALFCLQYTYNFNSWKYVARDDNILYNYLVSTTSDASNSINSVSKSLSDASNRINSVSKSLSEASNSINSVSKSLSDASNSINSVSKGFAECKTPDKDEDLLCLKPITFQKDFKNPCWKQNGTLKCLPYFQLIGFDKCGTTDLFDRIAKHPDIYGNAGVLKKETQWWPWLRYGHFMNQNVKRKTFDDYVRYFDGNTPSMSAKVKNGIHYSITGDGTPMDMWDFSGWRQIPQNFGLHEPKVLTPHLIHHINPATKFIILMRDPINRLYSDYIFLGLAGKTPQIFHQHVIASKQILDNCLKNSSLLTCLSERHLHLKWNFKARIHLGYYSVYLKEWLKVFPRDQFLIFKTEEYAVNTEQHLSEVFRFLGVNELSMDEMEAKGMLTEARKHQTQAKVHRQSMLAETRQLLKKMYEPYNKELLDILKDNRFTW